MGNLQVHIKFTAICNISSFSSLEDHLETDVCIIGNGIADLASACFLSKGGKKRRKLKSKLTLFSSVPLILYILLEGMNATYGYS